MELMEHLQELARIRLKKDEAADIETDLRQILAYVEQIEALDTEGIPEMSHPSGVFNRLREDEPKASLSQAEALSVAVEQEGGYFKVPRVME